MKKIFLSTVLVLLAAAAFASIQTKATQDKPWRIYLLGGTMNLSDDDHAVESDWSDLDASVCYASDSETKTSKNVAWINGLGGGGSGLTLNNSTSEGGYFVPYSNNDNLAETNSITLDWSGVGGEHQTTHKWGSDYGTSYDFPNFYPVDFYATISTYAANEHCAVKDTAHPPFWAYLENTSDLGPVLRQITQTETYQRYAQSVWHVQTGGKALPSRQSLWQFSGSAWEILDQRALPPYNHANLPEITNKTEIVLTDLGALKADGQLWLALPDNVDKDITPTVAGLDFYAFSVGGQKYRPTIQFGTNDVTGSNSTVIVGQLINPTCGWDANGGPTISNFLWTVPGYAIANFYVSSDAFQTNGHPVLFTLNTNSEADFYWADTRQKNVSCMINVKGVSLAVQTTFNVVRPSANIAAKTSSVELGREINNRWWGLCFGTNNGPAGISFSNTVTMPPENNYNFGSTNFSTEWVQLINTYSASATTTPDGVNHAKHSSGILLDSTYPYSSSKTTQGSPSVGESAGLQSAGAVAQDSTMWLMFKPQGGEWVPLKSVNWNWSGAVTLSGTNLVLISRSWTTNPTDADALGMYPAWTDNFSNTNSLNWSPPF